MPNCPNGYINIKAEKVLQGCANYMRAREQRIERARQKFLTYKMTPRKGIFWRPIRGLSLMEAELAWVTVSKEMFGTSPQQDAEMSGWLTTQAIEELQLAAESASAHTEIMVSIELVGYLKLKGI